MESRGWEGIVLYPVPIDRIAEVQALLAAPRGTWVPANPGETRGGDDRGAGSARVGWPGLPRRGRPGCHRGRSPCAR